jgi:AcrR family transcriptional regulator
MVTDGRARRGDTRQRIRDVALELFAEQGYEKTSLREIADRLDVTKAALYYHFKTKEDILVSLFEDLAKPVEELIAWVEEQPRTVETRREVVLRYGKAMESAGPFFRFMQENQATVRELNVGERLKALLQHLVELMVDDDAPLAARIRCTLAVFSMHGVHFILSGADATEEEKRAAAREVALDLVDFPVSRPAA